MSNNRDTLGDLNAIAMLAPVEMEAWCDGLTEYQRREATDTMYAAMQSFAWKAAYIRGRDMPFRGDQGHEEAVKQANRMLVKVRKMLRYSYPEQGQIHV